jgi:hypothetical protein
MRLQTFEQLQKEQVAERRHVRLRPHRDRCLSRDQQAAIDAAS